MKLLLLAIGISLASTCAAQQPQLPDYKPAQQVSGTIHIWGSPQMGDLLKIYEQGFHAVQPSVHFNDDLKSTITAVAGVYSGRADIGLLGREIWPTEVQAFASIEGHPPTVIDVATGSFDVPKATFALMVFVPKANPITSLSMQQLEAIFGAGKSSVHTWGELGLRGEWANRPIHLYGFSVENDKSMIFSQLVFHTGERWSAALHESSNGTGAHPIDAGELILRSVAADPNAIGISNVYYATPAVKALPIATSKTAPPVVPTSETVANRSYPLTRSVFMVLNSDAAHPAGAAVAEFLRFVLSRQGQQAVAKEGNYLPLTPTVAAQQLGLLQPSPK